MQLRESFLNEEHVRRNFMIKTQNTFASCRHIAEIYLENTIIPTGIDFSNESSVDAVSKKEIIPRCWNCDQLGHYFEDCLQERTIFCYGCGAKNTYKPQCVKCQNRKASKNSNVPVPPKELQ